MSDNAGEMIPIFTLVIVVLMALSSLSEERRLTPEEQCNNHAERYHVRTKMNVEGRCLFQYADEWLGLQEYRTAVRLYELRDL